jgi:hypothetical protein
MMIVLLGNVLARTQISIGKRFVYMNPMQRNAEMVKKINKDSKKSTPE